MTTEAAASHHDRVAERRRAVRRSIGDDSTPMVELDADGTVLFNGGDWHDVVGFTKPGSGGLDALASRVEDSATLVTAVRAALDHGVAAVLVCSSGSPSPFLKILPIPSATRHATNVLVGLSDTDEVPDVDPATRMPTAARVRRGDRPVASDIDAESRPAIEEGDTTAETDVSADTMVAPADDEQPAEGADPDEPVAGDDADEPRRTEGRSWAGVARTDWLAALAVVVFAFYLRSRGLNDLPGGLHGDEGITGLEARRVRADGWIGVYTGSALGQPTLPFYATGLSTAVFGESVWSIRIVSALAGAISVGLVWWMCRRRFDQPTALAAALALATLTWSIHFSRIAFGVAWWPVVAFGAACLVDRAVRTGEHRDWATAGAATALGVYVYNSHWFAGLAIALFIAGWTVVQLIGRRPVRELLPVGSAVGAGLIVLVPMLTYMADDRNGYFNHFDLVSKRNDDVWVDGGLWSRIGTAWGWYLDSWHLLTIEPALDGGDATGLIRMVPVLFTVLAAVGVASALRRHRTSFVALVVVVLAVLPLGASLTRDGLTRRDYAMAPFLAVLVGLGAAAIWRLVRDRFGGAAGLVAAAMLAVTFVVSGAVPYFTDFRSDPSQSWIFADELTHAVDAIEAVEGDGPVFVNWYSARHYYDYASLQFLLDTPGVTRTPLEQGFVETPSIDRFPEVTVDQLFVFIGDYARNADRALEQYPDARVVADVQIGPPVVVVRVPA